MIYRSNEFIDAMGVRCGDCHHLETHTYRDRTSHLCPRFRCDTEFGDSVVLRQDGDGNPLRLDQCLALFTD